MAVSHLLAVGSQIVGSRYLAHQRPAVSQGDFKWLEQEHEQLFCGWKCWSDSKVLGTKIALGPNCKLERDENICSSKCFSYWEHLTTRAGAEFPWSFVVQFLHWRLCLEQDRLCSTPDGKSKKVIPACGPGRRKKELLYLTLPMGSRAMS